VVSLASGGSEGAGYHMAVRLPFGPPVLWLCDAAAALCPVGEWRFIFVSRLRQHMRWSQTGNFGALPNSAMPNTFMAHAYDIGDPWADGEKSKNNCSHASAVTGKFDADCIPSDPETWNPAVRKIAPLMKNSSATPYFMGGTPSFPPLLRGLYLIGASLSELKIETHPRRGARRHPPSLQARGGPPPRGRAHEERLRPDDIRVLCPPCDLDPQTRSLGLKSIFCIKILSDFRDFRDPTILYEKFSWSQR
jgi:hypothetical protein